MLPSFIIEKIREMEERRQEVSLPLYVPEFPPNQDMPMTQSDDDRRGVVVIDM